MNESYLSLHLSIRRSIKLFQTILSDDHLSDQVVQKIFFEFMQKEKL